jgi:hypothetical protein
MAPTDPAFNLLALPRELRNHIYMFALLSPFPFWWPSASSPKHNVALGLLTANRQVHEEATPIMYTMNKFLFTHPSDCNIFRVIASPLSENITSVYLRIREKDVKLWTSYLGSTSPERSMQADLPKLKSLWIFLRCGTMGTPGVMGQFGGAVAAQGANLAAAGLAAQFQAMQHALGGQMTALHQQVQMQLQVLQQQVHVAMGQTPFANAPAPQAMPFAQFTQTQNVQAQNAQTQTAQAPQLPQGTFPAPHPHGQVNNPPPNPSPLAQQLAANAPAITHGPHPHLPPQPAHQHHPNPLFGAFLRFEREMGLESLCLSLEDIRRSPELDVKIVCIVKLPKTEVQRLLRVFADELTVDRNGDARTKFRRVHGVDVSLEVSGYEVGG